MKYAKTLSRDEMKNIMAGDPKKIKKDCPDGEFECNCMGETSCESSTQDCWDNC